MNVNYHVMPDGVARIVSGTPQALGVRENLTLTFDATCDSASVFFNRRRVDAKNGIAVIYNDKIREKNEITFQYTQGRTVHTVSCEALILRDGVLRGEEEDVESYAKLKQTVISLTAASEYLTKKVAELSAKAAELERRMNGADTFNF